DELGKPVSLRELQGQQHLVIVFTRGSLATVPAANKGPQLPPLETTPSPASPALHRPVVWPHPEPIIHHMLQATNGSWS
ncbi:hypothetical protein OVV29_38575, partial [Klebsiella pneumoniae]|nr:hypothetical protein [Klebsiella pneumoniae]